MGELRKDEEKSIIMETCDSNKSSITNLYKIILIFQTECIYISFVFEDNFRPYQQKIPLCISRNYTLLKETLQQVSR